ncbi:cytochrome b5, partial [Neoconidiobolus thromboides FSU 785]
KARNKIAVEPGHSPLDWARLSSSGKDLRGVTNIVGITLQELKQHNTEQDAWCALFGKVYNITPYMKFHPGGVKQLMKGAGKDATKLYNKVHPWVNAESLLNKCLVGFLV